MGWLFPDSQLQLVPPEDALRGGSTPVLPHPQPHAVLGTPIDRPWRPEQRVLIVGLGCFWGAEKVFWSLPGVESTAVGYAGGQTRNPTYREVCTGRTNHAEVVQIIFDPERISLEELVIKALESHDPTQGFRQGNDVGTQYRSVIYTTGENAVEEARVIERIVERYGARLVEHGYGAVTTAVAPLEGECYLAEEEHQQYLAKNPHGYCPHHSTGVACPMPEDL